MRSVFRYDDSTRNLGALVSGAMLLWLLLPAPAWAFEIGATQTCVGAPINLPIVPNCPPISQLVGNAIHEKITDDALSGFQYPSGKGLVSFQPSALNEIENANAAVDGLQQNPEFHFDACSNSNNTANSDDCLAPASQRLINGKAFLLAQLSQTSVINASQAHQLRVLLGSYLHILQDFYAHTNFVNAFPGSVAHLGTSPIPNQVAGTNPCISGPGALIYPNVPYLTSGWATRPPYLTAPSGQCAHGPPVPLCQLGSVVLPPGIATTCLLAGMHKDDPIRQFYQQAHDAALTDTANFAEDILLGASNSDSACMFMTDSPCSGSSGGGGGGGLACNLFNTGVDGTGKLLPTPTTDPHYSLSGGTAFVVQNGVFPLDGNWMVEDASSQSQWIGPSAVGGFGATFAQFVYHTTFNLTNSSTFTLSGQWATDNEGVDILINGMSTGNTIPAPAGVGYKTFTPFSISSGFQDGTNTLDFVVHNDDGPTGVRIEFFGTPSCP